MSAEPITIRTCLIVLVGVLISTVSGAEEDTLKVMIAGNPTRIGIASMWLRVDPLTDPLVIPARVREGYWTQSEIQRFVRLYFPRNYEILLTYDFMILASIEIWMLSDRQQEMLHDGVLEGIGGMQTRSVMSGHGYISIPWAESMLSDAFPNDADAVVSTDYVFHGLPMRVVFNRHPGVPPVLIPYADLSGITTSFPGYTTSLAIPKIGAVVVSYSVGPYLYGYPGAYSDPEFRNPGWIPHSMFWKYGKGVTWTLQDNFGVGDVFPFWNTNYNPYAPDMVLAMLIYSTGRTLPADVAQVHMLRSQFIEYDTIRGLAYSLIEFVDQFGATTDKIVEKLDSIGETVSEGKRLYRQNLYEEASELMDEALSEMDAVGREAMKLKDEAMMWVYLIQWLSVTGVSLIAGLVVWTLMVKRRLYREVAATRMRA
jgi:hypothetical protein